MNSLELNNAREDARRKLRQRVKQKTIKLFEDSVSLRARTMNGEDSDFEDCVEPDEVFACQGGDDNPGFFQIVAVIVTSFVIIYFFFW
tara:strand:- start:265 stop:528 length:264 start_codon:yes stop_codon:yes gene_type:complete